MLLLRNAGIKLRIFNSRRDAEATSQAAACSSVKIARSQPPSITASRDSFADQRYRQFPPHVQMRM